MAVTARRALAALAAAAAVLGAGPRGPRPLRAQARPATAAVAPSAATPGAFARADTAALGRALDSLVAPFEGARRGVVGYAVRNLDTGERLARRGGETFPTASLVKVAVLATVYDLVERKQLALDDPLTVLKIDQVPGSGQLQWMHPGLVVTVRDAAWLMGTTSDNTATNLLLDRIVIRRVWQKMEALGLPHTKIHSKVYLRLASVAPDSSAKYGLGVSTPDEMASLFELLARGRAVSPAADSAMLDLLEHNEDQQLLQRYVAGVRAAHKTGAVDAARTECTLWHLQSRVVACVFTKENQDQRWTIDTEPQLLMARLGQRVAAAWPPPAVRQPPPP